MSDINPLDKSFTQQIADLISRVGKLENAQQPITGLNGAIGSNFFQNNTNNLLTSSTTLNFAHGGLNVIDTTNPLTFQTGKNPSSFIVILDVTLNTTSGPVELQLIENGTNIFYDETFTTTGQKINYIKVFDVVAFATISITAKLFSTDNTSSVNIVNSKSHTLGYFLFGG